MLGCPVPSSTPILGRAQSLSQGAVSDFFICAPPLVEAYLAVGRHDAALDVAREAVGLASEQAKRGFLGWALQALGDAHARREPADLNGAETHYREALALAEELAMRPLEARCHLGLGRMYRRIGRRDDAQSELASAVALLRSMGMAFWLPDAESELAEVTPP